MFVSRRILASSAAAVIVVGSALVPFNGAQAAAPPQCRNADLHASFRHTDSGASHRFGRIVLKNLSQHSCRTGGYGLSYVGGGNGTRIGASVIPWRVGGASYSMVAIGTCSYDVGRDVIRPGCYGDRNL
jgi:hypothetical protein